MVKLPTLVSFVTCFFFSISEYAPYIGLMQPLLTSDLESRSDV